MLRSPLRRALAALSLAVPTGCADDGTPTGASATGTTTGTTTAATTDTTDETPTTGIEGTTTGAADETGDSGTTTATGGSTGSTGTTGTTTTTTTDATTGTGTGTNHPPKAEPDHYVTRAKQTLQIQALNGLLSNDSDPDGDPLTLVAADPFTPAGAKNVALVDGSFTYEPPPSLWGTDTFQYKIWDGKDGFAQAIARVDVRPTAIDLEYVADGLGGFVIDGQTPGHFSGRSVTAVGDLNGDGLDELAVATRNADDNAGRIYIIFGKVTGEPIALSKLAEQKKGYVIHGQVAGDMAGTTIAGAGDVDGDGKGDLIIGAPNANNVAGAAYVVFGKDTVDSVHLDLIELGQGGFAIHGAAAGDGAGCSVAGAGDVNGDGLADIVVGAYGADPGGPFSGSAYVVFGRKADKPTKLAEIAGGQGGGFAIQGEVALDFAGSAVAGAGDVDGDGLADILVGAYGHDTAGDGSGRAYLVFGKPDPIPVLLTDVAAGQGGRAFDGAAAYDRTGFAVAGAGDLDGDGFADLAIGAPLADSPADDAGRVYVVYGGPDLASGALPTLAAAPTGFTLAGTTSRDYAGTSVARAGDVDADGYDDLLVGAPGANPQGADSGRAYVVFGGPDLPSVGLQWIAGGNDGFALDGEALDDYCGFSVAPAGDVNGDGFADVITGARANDGKGDDAGRSYVVFGGDFSGASFKFYGPGPDTVLGTDGGESLVSGRGDDLITVHGPDVVYAGAGKDELRCDTLEFVRLDGGAGDDLLRLTGQGMTLDLTARSDLDVVDIEAVHLGDGNNLKLEWRDLRALSPRTHVFTVDGDSGTVDIDLTGAGFVDAGVQGGYHVWQHPVFTLRVAAALQANIAL